MIGQPKQPTFYIAHNPQLSQHASVMVTSTDEFYSDIKHPEHAYPMTLNVTLTNGLYIADPTIIVWKNAKSVIRFADGWQITVEKVVR